MHKDEVVYVYTMPRGYKVVWKLIQRLTNTHGCAKMDRVRVVQSKVYTQAIRVDLPVTFFFNRGEYDGLSVECPPDLTRRESTVLAALLVS